MSKQNTYMQTALQAAKISAERGEVPVGAVIVYNEDIISVAGNEIIQRRDPTAHAEILAIRSAAEKLGYERLIGCDLYVTLEPCAMCAGAISLARINRVMIGTLDAKGGAIMHGPRFFQQTTCHHRPEVTHGIMAEAAAEVLVSFFRALRGQKL